MDAEGKGGGERKRDLLVRYCTHVVASGPKARHVLLFHRFTLAVVVERKAAFIWRAPLELLPTWKMRE